MNIRGKTIWITGASAGIGKATAIEFAKRGAKTLILSARNERKLTAVKLEIENATDCKCLVFPLDLSETKDLEQQTSGLLASIGKIDCLFNNGGISQRANGSETAIEVDRRIMEVNFFGTIALTKIVLKNMIANGGGNIIVTSSLTGKFGFPLRTAYAASKHALHGYFESLQFEEAPNDVYVTMICPGRIKTDISVNALTKDGKPWSKSDEGQEKGMKVSDCAGVIADAVEKNKKEIVIGSFGEKMMVKIKRFNPSLFRWLVPKISHT